MTDKPSPSVDLIDDIPPFLRLPKNGTREATEWMVRSIDNRIRRLELLALRPHPRMLEYRTELIRQLEGNGPHALRVSSYVIWTTIRGNMLKI